jgi:hypothetical protein
MLQHTAASSGTHLPTRLLKRPPQLHEQGHVPLAPRCTD